LSESFIIKMKKYINFDNIDTKRLTPNVINNCYGYLKYISKRKLKNKSILPEVRLYYMINF